MLKQIVGHLSPTDPRLLLFLRNILRVIHSFSRRSRHLWRANNGGHVWAAHPWVAVVWPYFAVPLIVLRRVVVSSLPLQYLNTNVLFMNIAPTLARPG
jgi:hypothetical protein